MKTGAVVKIKGAIGREGIVTGQCKKGVAGSVWVRWDSGHIMAYMPSQLEEVTE